jgi:3-hydroxyisobutyrate dehydrogenase
MKAGIIGLGQIGGGIALWLAQEGVLAAVYDLRRDAAQGLEDLPPMAASPAEVARQSDVVIIAVLNAGQTIDVLDGSEGVLAGARPGLSVVLVATVAMEDLARIRMITEAAGVPLVDCGVAGGPGIRQRRLVSLVGATDAEFERVRGVLAGFSESVLHMGGPGSGMAAKIAMNTVITGTLRAGFEGAALARAAGIDIRRLAQAIDETATGRGPMMVMCRPNVPMSDAGEAATREGMRNIFVKDLDAALELGRALNVALPLAVLARNTSHEVFGVAAKRDELGAS